MFSTVDAPEEGSLCVWNGPQMITSFKSDQALSSVTVPLTPIIERVAPQTGPGRPCRSPSPISQPPPISKPQKRGNLNLRSEKCNDPSPSDARRSALRHDRSSTLIFGLQRRERKNGATESRN
ncbi:hypothetical protein J6590_039042 [Homalodisca vitripennis]|nr:hypothetical protein J6590_039042 [Homalodisca vitripennis]